MFGDDARRNVQDEPAYLLTDGNVVRLEAVKDSLAGRGIGHILAAGQCRPERSTLRGVFPLRFEKKGMLAPNVASASSTERLVDFRDLRGGRNRIADHTAADVAHDFGDSPVAIDDRRNAGIFCI